MRVPHITGHFDPDRRDLGNAGALALALQEPFTVVARLRSGRPVGNDARAFRAQVKQLLTVAHQDLRAAGYSDEAVRSGVYAFVAFLDESVLGSDQQMFAGWASKPLQEEIFGDHTAGEMFFRMLEELLQRANDAETIDVLEVYQLCLLLGFRGRYREDPLELERFREALDRRIERWRGRQPLAPDGGHPREPTPAGPRDPIVRPLAVGVATMLLAVVIAYIAFSWMLDGGFDSVTAAAAQAAVSDQP
jgi:type VI secretion system protein ImpK